MPENPVPSWNPRRLESVESLGHTVEDGSFATLSFLVKTPPDEFGYASDEADVIHQFPIRLLPGELLRLLNFLFRYFRCHVLFSLRLLYMISYTKRCANSMPEANPAEYSHAGARPFRAPHTEAARYTACGTAVWFPVATSCNPPVASYLRVRCVNRLDVQPFTPDAARQILTGHSDFETHQCHRRLSIPLFPVSNPLPSHLYKCEGSNPSNVHMTIIGFRQSRNH